MARPDLARLYEDPLPREEFDRRVARACADLDGEEGQEIAELIAWFQRRYPTALERLRYATRTYRQWTSSPKIPDDEIR